MSERIQHLICLIYPTFEQSLGSRGMSPIFTRCAQIVESGLVSAGLPCSRLLGDDYQVSFYTTVDGGWGVLG